jgi:hypothetical protein
MALKDLTSEAMINIIHTLLDEKHADHRLLASVAETAPWLRRLGVARQSLLAAQPATSTPERLAKLQAEAGAVDDRSDDILRGTFHALTGMAFLAGTHAKREKLLRLRDHLLPGGLSMTQKTYAETAGQAELLKARLTSETSKLLTSIRADDGATLGDHVGELVTLGARLGKLESERATLEAGRPAIGAERVRARLMWVRAMNALLGGLETVAEEQPPTGDLRKRLLLAISAQEGKGRSSEGEAALPVVEPAVPNPSGADSSAA